jgi:cyclopropane fatty-acyl-phospholipid synthase-like methyltransferase
LLAQIANGTCRDFKKEYQFFETPAALADRLVEMAQIQPGDAVLEPSAGQGAIVKAIQKKYSGTVDCFELMDINCSFLLKMEKVNLVGKDFLSYETMPKSKYDRIIANPPFSKNQDIDHIYKMFAWLRPGGCLVTIASKHWQICSNKKEKEFLEWLRLANAEIIDIDPGTFKESGTMVGGCILKIKAGFCLSFDDYLDIA